MKEKASTALLGSWSEKVWHSQGVCDVTGQLNQDISQSTKLLLMVQGLY